MVPRGAVAALESVAREHGREARSASARRRCPSRGIAALGEVAEVRLRRAQRGHARSRCRARSRTGRGWSPGSAVRFAGSREGLAARRRVRSSSAPRRARGVEESREGRVDAAEASHGEPAFRASSDACASSADTGVGLDPPSMKTRPSRSAAPARPSKSQVAYAVVIEPPSECPPGRRASRASSRRRPRGAGSSTATFMPTRART